MAFALVHFAVGFVSVLALVSALSITGYRLTCAYAGGVWALVPDVHQLDDGVLGALALELHGAPIADLFFFHYTLDGAVYRAHNIELTFVALVALGISFVLYDWRFGVDLPATRTLESAEESDDVS